MCFAKRVELPNINDLATSDIILGIALFTSRKVIFEDIILQMLLQYQKEDPDEQRRFDVRYINDRLYSEPISRILDLFSASLLRPLETKARGDAYRIDHECKISLERVLRSQQRIPKQEEAMKKLAEAYDTIAREIT